MELKKYNEYSDEEKRELLFHWWHYYGKTVCSLGVMRRFTQMVYDDVDEMFKIGLFSFMNGNNGKDFIEAIKSGRVYEYRDMVSRVSANSENNFDNEEKRDEFIELLVSSFEKNEDLIMSHEEYVDGIVKVVDDSSIVLTSDKVCDLYKKCLFAENELDNGKPTLPASVGDGVRSFGVFNSVKLEEHEKEVAEMVEQLPNIEQGTSFLDLNIDRYNRFWTSDYGIVDMLVQLGLATDCLEYVVPKRELNATMPSFVSTKVKQVDDNSAKEYKKVFNDGNN